MSHAYLLQENGDQLQLEQQSNSFLILETDDDTGIHLTGQPHATQALYTGERREQLITTEFTFRLRSCLIARTGIKICFRSALNIAIKTNAKIKSALIADARNVFKVKAALLFKKESFKSQFKATNLTPINYKAGLFANVKNIESKRRSKKIKKLLLKKLKELYDNGR